MEPESQLITAVAVLPGNATDARGALALVAWREENTGLSVSEVLADCAYGDGRTRQAFAERDLPLRANVPKRLNRSRFPKQDFEIDLETLSCTCPAGHVTTDLHTQGRDPHGDLCPLRSQCVSVRRGRSRMVTLHPQEGIAAGRACLPVP